MKVSDISSDSSFPSSVTGRGPNGSVGTAGNGRFDRAREEGRSQELCLAAGMDGYLTKPIRPEELDELVEKYTRAVTATAVPIRAET